MKVLEVMSRDVEPIPGDATIQQAALRMAEGDFGAVLVGGPDGLEGILTDRDIILRAVVDGRDVTTTTVREVMSSTLYTCRGEDEVADAFSEMSERQVRRLPVLDESGRLIGIVAMSDLARRETDPRRAAEALREIAEPHRIRASEPAPSPDAS